MNIFLSAFLFTCFVAGANSNIVDDVVSSIPTNVVEDVSAAEFKFFTWMKQHSKTYDTKVEKKLRLEIWKENNVFIEDHNSQQPSPSYSLGHNHFSDLTVDEYQELNKLGHYSPGLVVVAPRPKSYADDVIATKLRRDRQLHDVPDSIDWVDQGAIVPVKNQGKEKYAI